LAAQLSRTPLGARLEVVVRVKQRCFRAHWAAVLIVCLACRTADQASDLHLTYPELLRQAGISGFYQFQVGLDSTGAPNLRDFRVLASPNPGFDWGVRKAVAAWRPRVSPGTQSVEHTILFVVLPHGADSARACPPQRGYTVVCAMRAPIHVDTLYESVSH
jgi:hypothetical protein